MINHYISPTSITPTPTPQLTNQDQLFLADMAAPLIEKQWDAGEAPGSNRGRLWTDAPVAGLGMGLSGWLMAWYGVIFSDYYGG